MRSLPKFISTQTNSRALDRCQQAIQNLLDWLGSRPQLDSQLLVGQQLISGSTRFSHRLGRPWTGWRVVKKSAAADIWDAPDSTPSETLTLHASAPVTVSVEVF